ncbi:MAG: hypothetical protein OXT72_07565 [Gammaproteobacteria bacterium]|nr:hypothetical protein [Gammaproteobacteria bacterium]MDE0248952.1 hypothetical protein [Gammaproteobacteria bacterium]
MGHWAIPERWRFWLLALLWLPVGVAATFAIRFAPGTGAAEALMWLPMFLMSAASLVVVAPCGLPLALGCRRLWRQGYRRAAWASGIGLGAVTVAASLVAGLLGPVAILLYAVVLSLPVWAAGWWLGRHN